MPRQNRVTPFGVIVAVPERGTVMGNRGVLHNESGAIRRAWQLRRDEATALAAGHRPCAECRRNRFRTFCAAWKAGNDSTGNLTPKADAIDDRLHAERVSVRGEKRSFETPVSKLPDGVFVTLGEDADTAHLLWHGQLLAWSPGGYRKPRPIPKGQAVSVLTPASTVAAIRAGYIPDVHPSAAGVPS
jgi:hypothetical protein